MFTNNPFANTMNERWEKEQAEYDAFDSEFPYWQEAEAESEEGRFVSEFDMERDEFEEEMNRLNLMTWVEFAAYADNLEREREIMRDMEGWF